MRPNPDPLLERGDEARGNLDGAPLLGDHSLCQYVLRVGDLLYLAEFAQEGCRFFRGRLAVR